MNLEEKTLSELMELRSAIKMLFDKYTNELTTYSVLNNDKFFERISQGEKALFNKKDNAFKIMNLIDDEIEKRVFSNV